MRSAGQARSGMMRSLALITLAAAAASGAPLTAFAADRPRDGGGRRRGYQPSGVLRGRLSGRVSPRSRRIARERGQGRDVPRRPGRC
jgi:hypothetical protein